MNDTLATQIIENAVTIGQAVKGGNIINGVPNSLISAGLMLIYGLIHRAIEKRRLRKKGLLIDKA